MTKIEFPITLEGKKRLDEELENLIKIERESIKNAIAEARAQGDLRENAEYHAAKEKQSHIEGRIMELQGKLARARVVDVSKLNSEIIVFGATVTILDPEKEIEITYQLVGDEEANIKHGKISFTGPLGRALIGKSEGETIIVDAPKGKIEYEIISFEFK